MRAAIYCRVSTEEQEREGTSLTSQQKACEQFARERGYVSIAGHGHGSPVAGVGPFVGRAQASPRRRGRHRLATPRRNHQRQKDSQHYLRLRHDNSSNAFMRVNMSVGGGVTNRNRFSVTG